MASKLQYFGLILLLVGVVCLVVGEVNMGNAKLVEVGREYSVWSYACNLTDGETYRVDIFSSDDWSTPFTQGGVEEPLPVNVTITSPLGGVTSLQAFFYGESSGGALYRQGTLPTMVGVTYKNVDYASLSVDSSSSQIRFTVKQNGFYIVEVIQEDMWSKQPPDYMTFYHYLAPNRGTYSLLASGGGAGAALGGASFIVALFRKQRVKRKRAAK